MAILLGLFAAGCYGAADFCGGLAARRTAIFAVLVSSQFTGLVLLAALLPFFGGVPDTAAMLYGALGGICGAAGIALLYYALAIGTMGVVSPITAVVAAALPVAVGLLHGDHVKPAQFAGIALALVAIVMISVSPQAKATGRHAGAGVREALLSGIALGGFYIFLALTGKTAGLYPLLFARVASVVLLLLAAYAMRRTIVPAAGAVGTVVLAGGLDIAANVCYVLAAYGGYLSIAAVLTSLYPASTVFLARVVLGEKLAAVQKAGVVLALAGVTLIAAG